MFQTKNFLKYSKMKRYSRNFQMSGQMISCSQTSMFQRENGWMLDLKKLS